MRPKLPALSQLAPYLRRIDETRIYSNFGPLSVLLEQRIAQLESDLRKATDRTEVLGAQLSDARRTADEANEGRKKLEADLAALLIRIETLEDAAGGAVAAGTGPAA